ncbi:MAG TPA: VWA domain-containing protein [Pyrinomonadaceae bacterium]|nr:VWA domain-containing protein [Pyrinomonadaceae bacterium]
MPVSLKDFLFRRLPVAFIIVGAAICAVAQNPRPSPTPLPQDTQGTVRIPVRRVRLPITVTDKKGNFVPGLSKEDFVVLEDKVPQTIETFSDDLAQTTPLYVAVLMDTSPSTAGKLKFQQESAMNFIQTVIKPRKDRVLFATFDDEIKLRQDFTDKLDLLDKAVYSVKQMGKQTALFDAVWQFCDEKMRSVPGRRVLLIVTDGEDTYSRANLRDAIDIAQRTETTVFAISTKAGFLATVPGVEAGQVADKKDRDLQTLSEETGGMAFFTGDMLSLERSFTRISKELRAQYLVTYDPTNKSYDGTFRKIDVKLAERRGDLKVRTKKGYKAIADSVLQ